MDWFVWGGIGGLILGILMILVAVYGDEIGYASTNKESTKIFFYVVGAIAIVASLIIMGVSYYEKRSTEIKSTATVKEMQSST